MATRAFRIDYFALGCRELASTLLGMWKGICASLTAISGRLWSGHRAITLLGGLSVGANLFAFGFLATDSIFIDLGLGTFIELRAALGRVRAYTLRFRTCLDGFGGFAAALGILGFGSIGADLFAIGLLATRALWVDGLLLAVLDLALLFPGLAGRTAARLGLVD